MNKELGFKVLSFVVGLLLAISAYFLQRSIEGGTDAVNELKTTVVMVLNRLSYNDGRIKSNETRIDEEAGSRKYAIRLLDERLRGVEADMARLKALKEKE